MAWYTVPCTAFTLSRGESVVYASSPEVLRSFCGTCGSTLTFRHAKRPAEIDITIASLDDPGSVPPTGLVFTSQKLVWDIEPDLPTVYDRSEMNEKSGRHTL